MMHVVHLLCSAALRLLLFPGPRHGGLCVLAYGGCQPTGDPHGQPGELESRIQAIHRCPGKEAAGALLLSLALWLGLSLCSQS